MKRISHLIYTLNDDIPYDEYYASVSRVVPNSTVKVFDSLSTPRSEENTASI